MTAFMAIHVHSRQVRPADLCLSSVFHRRRNVIHRCQTDLKQIISLGSDDK